MWTFGWKHDWQLPYRTNFCPYFWMTIFCILVSPIVLIFKSIKYAFVFSIEKTHDLFDIIDEKLVAPQRNKAYANPSEKELWEMWKHKSEWGTKHRINKWLLDKSNTMEKLKKIAEIYEARRISKQLAEAEKEEKRRKFFANIVKVTKYIVPVLGIIVLAGVALGLYKLFANVIMPYWYNIDWARTFAVTAVIISLVVIVVALCFFFAFMRGYAEQILKVLTFIFKPVTAFFSFVSKYFVAYKEQNCPMIVWED